VKFEEKKLICKNCCLNTTCEFEPIHQNKECPCIKCFLAFICSQACEPRQDFAIKQMTTIGD